MIRSISFLAQPSFPHISNPLARQLGGVRVPLLRSLSRPASSESNQVALATKDQLHRVELGLAREISGVENRLTEKFTKEISGVREGLTKEISGVESRLTEKFTKEISGVREGLTKEISGVREQMEKNQAALLVAIHGQNTKFEAFKLHIYKLIASLVAAGIGFANRDRLVQGISGTLKP